MLSGSCASSSRRTGELRVRSLQLPATPRPCPGQQGRWMAGRIQLRLCGHRLPRAHGEAGSPVTVVSLPAEGGRPQAGLEVRMGDSHELRIRIRSPRFSSDRGNRHAGLMATLGSRRAATDRYGNQHDRWRIVADRRRARTVTPALACGFPMILPGLSPSDVQGGSGSWDLTRKRTEVQLLPRPPHPL